MSFLKMTLLGMYVTEVTVYMRNNAYRLKSLSAPQPCGTPARLLSRTMIAFLVLIGSVAVYGQGNGPAHNHSCTHNNHHQILAKQVVVNIIADMDKDGDGLVELPEVNAEFISRYDLDKDGEVPENEFVKQWHQRYHDDRDFVGYLFHHFDVNDDQKLTSTDLATLAKTLDADGNGEVSIAEFQSFMTNLYVNCVPSNYSHGP